jgi:hypothetical protein
MCIRLQFNSIQNFALFIKDNFKPETKHWRLSGSATFLIHVAEKHRNRGAYFRITVNTALKHHTIRTVCEEKASKLILIIVHRDATQSSRFIILRVHSTCFGCQPHPASGVHKTVTTASGSGHIFVQLPPSNVAKLHPTSGVHKTVTIASGTGYIFVQLPPSNVA